MDNHEKARQIVDGMIAKDYGGELAAFQAECGDAAAVIIDVYFWLEDGHGDNKTVEECRLLWELD